MHDEILVDTLAMADTLAMVDTLAMARMDCTACVLNERLKP